MKRYSIVPTATGNVLRQTKFGSYVPYEDAADLQRQLAEITRERDTLKAMVDLHDALNDRRRAQGAFEGTERRVRHGR